MNTREFGNELENYIVDKFKELCYTYCKRSKNSGANGQLGDITGQDITVVECKNRNTKDIQIKEDVWKKLCESIPLHSKRFPLYILQNKNQKRWAVLDVDDFFRILKGYLKNEN